MKYSVFYPTPLDEINSRDGNVDVCVTFADGQYCTFVFATPQNLVALMKGRRSLIWSPVCPFSSWMS